MISLKNTSNNFNISDYELNCILNFLGGRIDFYWEYLNGVPFMAKETLPMDKLNIHFLGGNALGFSPFVDNKTIMFLGWDFDAHTSNDLTEEENNKLVVTAQEDAQKVFDFLDKQGLKVILNSSGSSGRHVRLYCKGANAKQMRIYGHYVLLKLFGDHNKHEVFPKQNDLNEERKYGNQMKGLLCVHPKHKKRANVMVDNKILDFHESIKEIVRISELGNKGVIISPEDFEKTEALMEGKTFSKSKFDSSKFQSKSNSDYRIPLCKFIEEVATKKVLPSKNKYARHTCIDPNIQAYSYFSPNAKIEYAKIQGRRNDTAFKNWEHYWEGGKPKLKCEQIISYLKNHLENNNCVEGLKICKNCPQFKNFIEEKKKPYGIAKELIISEIAKQNKMELCPSCKNKLLLDNDRGLWYCKKCKRGGNISKFIKIIHLFKKFQEQLK